MLSQTLKAILKKIWFLQFKIGVKDEHLALLSNPEFYSKNDNKWNLEKTNDSSGIGGWFNANNHSHGYHGILKQWWEHYELGSKCLLVSESIETNKSFSDYYPDTKFISTDYFLDITDDINNKTDIIWNLYLDPPSNLMESKVNSILCQATLEHLIDPVQVMRNLTKTLKSNGHIFIHTHTPLYPYHACPRDYLRYQTDWFLDIGEHLSDIEIVELIAIEGHIFACFVKK